MRYLEQQWHLNQRFSQGFLLEITLLQDGQIATGEFRRIRFAGRNRQRNARGLKSKVLARDISEIGRLALLDQ